MRLRSALPLSALLLAGLSACGGGGSTTDSGPCSADGNAVDVYAVDGIAWNAGNYCAESADGQVTINGFNNSSLPHNLHVQDSSGAAVTEQFVDLPSKGAEGTLSLSLALGEYRIVCLIPGHSNMKATLTVTEPGAVTDASTTTGA